MRYGECDGCLVGEHDKHRRVVQAAPEGMLGGVICPCKGECATDPEAKRREFLDRMLGPGTVDLLIGEKE